MADRRFPTSFKDVPDADEPGLVLGDDNVVYLIKPDGSRVAVGSGGSSSLSLPVAEPTGAFVDTTTYDDNVNGVGKLTTIVMAPNTPLFAAAIEGDAFPRWIFVANPSDGGFCVSDGTVDPYLGGPTITLNFPDLLVNPAPGGTVVVNGKRVPQDLGIATHEVFLSPSPQPVTDGGFTHLDWVHSSGDSILNLSDPSAPIPPAGGIYVVSISIYCEAAQAAGKHAQMALQGPQNSFAEQTIPLDSDIVAETPAGSVTVAFAADGNFLQAGVRHAVSGDVGFTLGATVQRLITI